MSVRKKFKYSFKTFSEKNVLDIFLDFIPTSNLCYIVRRQTFIRHFIEFDWPNSTGGSSYGAQVLP